MRKPGDRLGIEFTVGVVLGVTLFGCVSATFPYHYYGMDFVSYEGKLLGPTEAQDIDASICIPTQTDKSPCTVMKTSDFLQMKYNYLDTENKLIACERGHQ